MIKINDCDAINAVVMQTNEHNRDIGNDIKHTKETTMRQRVNVHTGPPKPEVTRPEVTRPKPLVTRPEPEVTRPKPEVTRPKPAVTSKSKVLHDPVLREYTDVFEGLGCLVGNYPARQPSKTKYMLFHFSQRNVSNIELTLKIDDHPIE